MSWLSKLTGVHLGNIGAPIGAALGSVIPGVGTALGAGLGQAIGGIGHGDGVVKSALEGGATYGLGKLAGVGRSGAQPTGINDPVGGSSGNPYGDGVANANVSYGDTGGGSGDSGGLLSQFRPLLSGVGNSLGLTGGSGPGGLNLSNLLQTGAGAEGVYNALQSNKLRSQAMDAATQNFAQRAPLRTAGVNMLSPITRQSAMAPYVNQANPFAQAQFRQLNGTGA